ncbi:MAG: MipA/OmpV family protein [Beijerinckiaceae bacterium]|nr:MipA/OmpV family protein [Beijerinckiaceae bacterium]
MQQAGALTATGLIKRLGLGVAAASMGCALAGVGHAADPAADFDGIIRKPVDRMMQALKGEFTLTVGSRVYFEPRFDGAKSGKFTGAPLISVKPKGSFEKFTSPRDSSGITVFDTERINIGPALNFQAERLSSDDRALRGRKNIDFVIEPGIFIEYFPTDFLRLRSEFRQGLGGHHGQIFDFSADAYTRLGEDKRWFVAAGPRLTLATGAALKPYFDVTPLQSAASGLPVYRNGGGLRSVGFGGALRYSWTRRFETEIFGEYERLLDGVADSPLVRQRGDPNQYRIGIGATYKFDFLSPM